MRRLPAATQSNYSGGYAGRYAYVLVTPARNEAEYIEETIKSVITQTLLPVRWVIVNDGSNDATEAIAKRYAAQYPWIEVLRTPKRSERHFAGKIQAFNAGYARLVNLTYDIIGSLDADITFDPDYFAFLLGKFAENTELGVAGTPFSEGSQQYDYRFTNIDHVSGACQMFRRECFEAIGGYTAIKGGGVDWVAVTTARMKGWQTRTFDEKVCAHNRPIGTAQSGALVARFRLGKKDYYLGGHPLWELFRGIYQMKQKPYLLGGLFLLAGYSWGFLRRAEKPIKKELIAFHRREQMNRLKTLFRRMPRGGQ
jgi:biofilm PGA synthesis N-glycosyltransferase PgaC